MRFNAENIGTQEHFEQLGEEARLVIAPFSPSQPKEDPEEVLDSEIRSHTTKLLRSYFTPVASNRERYVLDEVDTELPRPQHIGSQFSRKLQVAFLSPECVNGLGLFHAINGDTDDQKKILESTDEQFEDVWHRIHNFFERKQSSIEEVVNARFATDSNNGHENRSAFKNNDTYQFKGRETARSLSAVLTNGLEISVDPQGIAILRQAENERDSQEIPIIELVKNWPILSISGFAGSKISLAAHDAIDHVWTFDLAQNSGLLSKYEQLFKSIGEPHRTDIFKREGEILASISFGERYWERQEGFVPLIETDFIKSHLVELDKKGHLRKIHERAVKIVDSLQPGTEDYERLGFVFSNYLVTLHEQRRRYGQIKQRNPETGNFSGELSPLSADFLCFLIELNHEISSSTSERDSAITDIHTTLEEYLQSIVRNKSRQSKSLILQPSVPRKAVKLSSDNTSWLMRNPRFSTIKERIQND